MSVLESMGYLSYVPLKRPWGRYPRQVCGGTTTAADVALAYRSLFSREILEGPSVALYEQAFARYVGTRHAYSFGKGRVALYAILTSLGAGEDDEIILPGYTCVVVPQAIRHCKARPVYADICPSTYNVALETLESKVTSRTKGLIIQHTYGIPAAAGDIVSWAHSKGLWVVEDCAHALGATLDGRQVGSFGDAAFFSSEHSKVISTGQGGIAVTDRDDLAEKLDRAQQGCHMPANTLTRKLLAEFVILGTVGSPRLMFAGYASSILLRRLLGVPKSTTEQEMAGGRPAHYALRLSNAQAAIGLSQLKNLEWNLSHRRAAGQFNAEQLLSHGAPSWTLASSRPAFVRYPVRVTDKQLVVRQARMEGIEIGVWFTSPIHPAGSSLKAAAYRLGICPRAEEAVAHTVNLPTHPKITMDDMERAVKIIQPFLAEERNR